MSTHSKSSRFRNVRPLLVGFKAALIYFVCVVIWFAVMDRLAKSMSADIGRQETIKGLTGFVFVFGTAFLISLLVRRELIKQQRAQKDIQESENRFRLAADSAPVLMWMSGSMATGIGWFNRPWLEFVGRPMNDELESGWRRGVHPDDLPGLLATLAAAMNERRPVQAEHRLRRHDGEYRWVLNAAIPRTAEGGFAGLVGSCIDITDRKQFEQKLESQLSRLDLLSRTTRAIGERQDLSSIFHVVVRCLEDSLPVDFGCVCLCNPSKESVTVSCVGNKSRSLAEELGLEVGTRIGIDNNGLSRCLNGKLVYEPDVLQIRAPFPQWLSRGGLRALVIAPMLVESSVLGILVVARRDAAAFSSSDCEFLRQLSEHVGLAAHQAQLYHALQEAYNELRQTQQAVMQQERLRALGQMASGIAHDINNALSPVALYAGFLLESEKAMSDKGREYLEIISRAVDDVAATVARLREFYRQREPQLTLVRLGLNRLVEDVLELTSARWNDMPQELGTVINVERELAPDLPEVLGVESEIREALTNLVLNAVDAMPSGGTLKVRTGVQPRDAGEQRPASVLVEVSDTGVGMDEETQRKCLEPFYTTKGERGTGLGLAMVYGVVQRHGGDINIQSRLGEGTSMQLSFNEASGKEIQRERVESAGAGRTRMRILIVDDDPVLLKSLRDILESDGHVVSATGNGQEALAAFAAAQGEGEPFSVVISDLGMPYMDGRKVASAVKQASPATPVILLTGWGQRIVAENDIPPGVDRVLSKPPKVGDLRDALGKCVPGPAS